MAHLVLPLNKYIKLWSADQTLSDQAKNNIKPKVRAMIRLKIFLPPVISCRVAVIGLVA
jgi:hypothetical protein